MGYYILTGTGDIYRLFDTEDTYILFVNRGFLENDWNMAYL
jgi:hypothetical protein